VPSPTIPAQQDRSPATVPGAPIVAPRSVETGKKPPTPSRDPRPGEPVSRQLQSLLVIALLLVLPCAAHATDHAVLFIGNSYTSASAPYSLDESYRQLILEGVPAWTDLSIESYTPGGWNLSQHHDSANTEGSVLYDYLHDTDPDHQWDYVVVHDQSQIPGFPQDRALYNNSRNGAVGLAELIEARGAGMKLWMTWGRVDGDSDNLWIYPNYPTMQGLLATGYESYVDAITAAGHSADLIPVGLGWQMIHDEAVAQGQDPQEASQLFARLYSGDGSHPSTLGTYLSACIIYTFTTGTSPVGLTWAHEGISDQDRLTLQQTAERLLAEDGDDNSADDDSADDDSADDDDSAGDDDSADDDDSAGEDSTGDDDSAGDPDNQQAASNCGCGVSSPAKGAPWMLLPPAWIAVRRRRRWFRPQPSSSTSNAAA